MSPMMMTAADHADIALKPADPAYRFGPFTMTGRFLRHQDFPRALRLSEQEQAFLACLAEHNPTPVSKHTFLREVWGYGDPDRIESRCVDMQCSKLRRKLQRSFNEAGLELIQTIRGVGYGLAVDSSFVD